MVTGYTVALFTLLLPGCLIGIAAGFHMVYMAADTDTSADWKPPGVIKRRSYKGPKPKRPRKTGRKLHSKIHKQEGESFSEFRCHETSQNQTDTVSKAMGSLLFFFISYPVTGKEPGATWTDLPYYGRIFIIEQLRSKSICHFGADLNKWNRNRYF